MSSKPIFLAVLVASLSLGSPLAARADTREQARAAFMQGRAAFKKGDYEQAAKHLQRAYDLKPHPALLRYLGQTHLKLGKATLAIENFERYIKEAPQAPDKEKIQARIVKIKKALAKARAEAAAKAKAPSASSSPTPGAAGTTGAKARDPKITMAPTGEDDEMPDVMGGSKAAVPSGKTPTADQPSGGSSGRWMRYGKWTSVALGAGGLAAGLVFNLLASSKASELEDAAKGTNPELNQPTVAYNAEHFAMQQDYKRFNTMAVVSYIVGGVFTATAVTLFLLDRGSDSAEQPARQTAVLPWAGQDGAGIAASVTF